MCIAVRTTRKCQLCVYASASAHRTAFARTAHAFCWCPASKSSTRGLFVHAIHNETQHAIESNKLIATAVQQAASCSKSCIYINALVDILQYPSVYMCEVQSKAESIEWSTTRSLRHVYCRLNRKDMPALRLCVDVCMSRSICSYLACVLLMLCNQIISTCFVYVCYP